MFETDARAEALRALSQFLVADASLGDTLQRVAEITVDAVPAAEIAGMTLLDQRGRPTTAIYTDTESPEIDSAQYEAGRGPCLDAWRSGEIVRVDDMARDGAERYPEFAAAAREHGVMCTLSLPLVAARESLGALNLYARTEDAFSIGDEGLGRELAGAASVVLANASAYWQSSAMSTNLHEAMKSRAIIEQAKGMLMARSPDMTSDQAFDLLAKASQRENVKLREIAERIVRRLPPTSGE